MELADDRRDPMRELPRPGPIGLTIRVILGAALIYFFVPLLTKWNVLLENDPIESERYYTLATLWLLPYVFNFTFRQQWGPWPTVIFVAGGAALGVPGMPYPASSGTPSWRAGCTRVMCWSGPTWPCPSQWR